VEQLRNSPHLSIGTGFDPHAFGFVRLVALCLALVAALVAVEVGAIYFVDALR
jgi:hypothetical protein